MVLQWRRRVASFSVCLSFGYPVPLWPGGGFRQDLLTQQLFLLLMISAKLLLRQKKRSSSLIELAFKKHGKGGHKKWAEICWLILLSELPNLQAVCTLSAWKQLEFLIRLQFQVGTWCGHVCLVWHPKTKVHFNWLLDATSLNFLLKCPSHASSWGCIICGRCTLSVYLCGAPIVEYVGVFLLKYYEILCAC